MQAKRMPTYMAAYHPTQADLPPPPPPQTQIPSLPLPPASYVTQYSDENVRRGRVPRPPPPPTAHDAYTMYGQAFHADDPIIKPLEAQVSGHTLQILYLHFYKFKRFTVQPKFTFESICS